MVKVIKLFPYNPAWPEIFETESCFIKQVLMENCIEIHHIGSTSIPQIAAKQDIDILCVVSDLSYSLILQEHGFVFKGELNIPLRYFFSKNTEISKVNLHVVEPDHGMITEKLCFRDYMRNNADARNEYERLKYQLLQDASASERISNTSPFTNYTIGKNLFIKNALHKAGFDGYSINFCLHTKEVEDYHRIIKSKFPEYDTNNYSINCHNFILYKGSTIVTVAMIEVKHNDALVKFLVTDEKYIKQGHDIYMMNILKKWSSLHGYHIL